MTIGLKEAIQIVKNEPDPSALVGNPELTEFLNSLNRIGTDSLKGLGKDVSHAAVAFVQVGVLSYLIQKVMKEGDTQEIFELMMLSNSEMFENAIILAVKYAIGLSISEEIR